MQGEQIMTPEDRAALREAASRVVEAEREMHSASLCAPRTMRERSAEEELYAARRDWTRHPTPAAVAWLVSEADAADALRAENARLREALDALQHAMVEIGNICLNFQDMPDTALGHIADAVRTALEPGA